LYSCYIIIIIIIIIIIYVFLDSAYVKSRGLSQPKNFTPLKFFVLNDLQTAVNTRQ